MILLINRATWHKKKLDSFVWNWHYCYVCMRSLESLHPSVTIWLTLSVNWDDDVESRLCQQSYKSLIGGFAHWLLTSIITKLVNWVHFIHGASYLGPRWMKLRVFMFNRRLHWAVIICSILAGVFAAGRAETWLARAKAFQFKLAGWNDRPILGGSVLSQNIMVEDLVNGMGLALAIPCFASVNFFGFPTKRWLWGCLVRFLVAVKPCRVRIDNRDMCLVGLPQRLEVRAG